MYFKNLTFFTDSFSSNIKRFRTFSQIFGNRNFLSDFFLYVRAITYRYQSINHRKLNYIISRKKLWSQIHSIGRYIFICWAYGWYQLRVFSIILSIALSLPLNILQTILWFVNRVHRGTYNKRMFLNIWNIAPLHAVHEVPT